MNKSVIKPFSSLYWQISLLFIAVLIGFAAISIYISVRSAEKYSLEINQKLNRELAANTVQNMKDLWQNGTINQSAVQDIMHSMMVINPSVEVYLLDRNGKILSYVAPEKVVKLEAVNVQPIQHFIRQTTDKIIYGDDPRNPGEQKIFSASEVFENGELSGYVYIVLASQEYVSTSQMVVGSYIMGLSINSIVIILISSALLGLLALWFITKRLSLIINAISRFRLGDLATRIPVKHNNELDKIGIVFNEMAQTIEHNIEELKGIDNLRRELIGNVSHDLRTPVASIQGYAETLLLKKDNLKPGEQEEYLNIIYNSCERLKKQVADLFELSKLTSNQVTLKREPFSVTELVQDIATKYRLISQKKGVSINIIVDKTIPVVDADISLIDRVFQNLIDNAIRYCNSGDYINIEFQSTNNNGVEIRVADSGKGIEPDELPLIFERYYKGQNNERSTGLGLAIVKKIIDLHQSTINVKSFPNQGTSFIFTLPAAKIA